MKQIKIWIFILIYISSHTDTVIKGQSSISDNYEVFEGERKFSNSEKGNHSIGEIISLILYSNKEFEIRKSWHGYDYTSTEPIMKGSLIMSKDQIRCYNPIRKENYLLERIDENRLINKTMPYLGDTLYIKMKVKDGSRQFIGNWMQGKKNGLWIYYKNGKHYQKQLFKDGILVKTENYD